MLDKLKSFFSKKKKDTNLEDTYTTIITDKSVEVRHPRRATKSISWDDINSIWIITLGKKTINI